MNPFDARIISWVNSLSHRWFVLDATVALIATNNFIKGVVITAMIWWAWFRNDENRRTNREFLIAGLAAGFVAVVAARSLAEMLPYRERPMHNPEVHFRMPYMSNEGMMIHWSAFPSDHAALFFALALAIYFVSRRVGIVALIYTFLIIAAPRVYMGYHHPTDILAGAAMGLGATALSKVSAIRTAVSAPVLRWREQSPGLFYAGFFLLTFQISTTFDSMRHILRYFQQVAKAILFGAP